MMTDGIDLSGDITVALDGAYARGNPVVVGYTNAQGRPELTVRGSVHVHGPTQIAIWARSRDTGLAKAIENNPAASLLFFGSNDLGPKMLLTMKGIAKADPSQNDKVYSTMIPGERDHDPEAKGVAVIVDVEEVSGFSVASGPIRQTA
jgi:hypothetical protein